MLLALAWKNIWRNKNRSLIVVLAIAFGLWGGLFSGGLMVSMGESMVNSAIDRDLAHIQIHNPRYDENNDIKQFIPDPEKVFAVLKKEPDILAFSARTRFLGMASSATSSYPVHITGIDPEQEKKVTTLSEKIIEGDYFVTEHGISIVIGKKLAKRLKLRLHSKMVLGFEGLNGDLINIACRVVGIYKTESSMFDEMNVFLNQKYLFDVLDTQPIYHEIAIRSPNAEVVAALTLKLKKQFPALKVESWKERAPEIAFISDLMIQYTYLFLVFILFAVLFGITNTMLMSVIDRIRELGMLIAIGMKRVKIFSMILLETLLLSFTGGLLGIILGMGTIAIFSHVGINLSVFEASLESFGSSSILYPVLPAEMYVILTILIVATANIAALMPAWKAIRLEPAKAIRSY
ncbi:MAG: ABC transporter permease [Calditrichaeota bacterium]|nr:ABC transporter permease [Calditrichota bacterium]